MKMEWLAEISLRLGESFTSRKPYFRPDVGH